MKASFFDHLEKLKKFDLFGQPVSILIDRQKLHQTYFGSLLSFIVLGIVLYTFSIGIDEALSGSNPKVTSKKTLLEPLELYTFEKNQLLLLGQVLTPNGKIITNQQNKTYYTISFGACNGIGTDVKCTIIPSVICGDSISEYAQSIGADNLKATTAYCMPPEYRNNFTFTFQGQILSTEFSYVFMQVQKCFNSTKFNYSINLYDQACASPEEIEVALYNSYLIYTYSKMELDPNKNGNPYKLLAQYSIIRLQPGQKKTTYIYYAKSISQTDLNFWLVTNEQQTYEALEYSGETMEVQNIEEYDPVLAISFFALSNNKITYTRTYGNIFDILGKVGGLLSLLTSILKFTVQLYQWFDLKMSILKLLNLRENNENSQLVGQKSLSKGLTMSVMNYLTNRSDRAKLKWHIEDIERQIDIVEILTKMRGIEFMKKQIEELYSRNPGGGMILDRSQIPLDKSDVILEKLKVDKEESYNLNQEGQASQIHMFSPNYTSGHQLHARQI